MTRTHRRHAQALAIGLLIAAGTAQAETLPAPPPATAPSPADATASRLQTRWAEIKYQVPDRKQQLAELNALAAEGAAAMAQHPASTELKVWQAIILSTEAGIDGSMGALAKVREAKALLEAADFFFHATPTTEIYTSLGSLYYQVPGWPIGFGDNRQAEAYLKKALAVNPNGIDPNYFYGDYLVYRGRYREAIPVLEKALRAPPRPNRAVADAGRRQEIQAALSVARAKATELTN